MADEPIIRPRRIREIIISWHCGGCSVFSQCLTPCPKAPTIRYTHCELEPPRFAIVPDGFAWDDLEEMMLFLGDKGRVGWSYSLPGNIVECFDDRTRMAFKLRFGF